MARALLGLLVAGVASASPAAFAPDIEHKTFVLTGLNVGLVSDDRGTEAAAGAEISVAHFATGGWFGAYADAMIDAHRGRFGVGGEVGYSALGIDAGFVFDRDGVGLRIRGVATAGIASICVGPVIPLSGGSGWVEVSLLAKWPFEL